MTLRPEDLRIYHITHLENLNGILAAGGLWSDAIVARQNPAVIGYEHIKQRRLNEIRVPCSGNRFVGEFVPFYFCPRSPMLYTINVGGTGLPRGCQSSIIHLVSRVSIAVSLGTPWAISDGNAGAYHTSFYDQLSALDDIDWDAIRTDSWQGKTHQKAAEFLAADTYSWSAFEEIGCENEKTASEVEQLLIGQKHQPRVTVQRAWYY